MKGAGGSFVSRNATIIEQQQILTTQNLATILFRLDLIDELKPQSIELAQSCFRWVCQQLQIPDSSFHARLMKVKNSAYAWRQMGVFLSLAGASYQRTFLKWAVEHMEEHPEAFFERFEFAVRNLEAAISANLISTPLFLTRNSI